MKLLNSRHSLPSFQIQTSKAQVAIILKTDGSQRAAVCYILWESDTHSQSSIYERPRPRLHGDFRIGERKPDLVFLGVIMIYDAVLDLDVFQPPGHVSSRRVRMAFRKQWALKSLEYG